MEGDTSEEPDECKVVEPIGWGGGILDCMAGGDAPDTTGSWEILTTANKANNQWRTKTASGYRITFVVDSGTAKTMAARNMVPGLKPYKIVNTGKQIRVAEVTLIPNE